MLNRREGIQMIQVINHHKSFGLSKQSGHPDCFFYMLFLSH